jgi:uncharacterized protein
MADRIALGVMARAPSDDRGKTRLVRALGIDDGADLRRAILLDTLEAIRLVRLADRILLFTPDDARSEIAGLGADVAHLMPQRGETLSQRIERGFADLFALGYDAAALIGSDLPTLPASHVEQGIEALMRHPDPLVLGPAHDGGYYFIGLRRPHPELFQGVPWSTADVLAATLAIAAREGLSLTLIPSWYDVDTVPDLERALGTGASSPLSGGARHLQAWATRCRPSSPAATRVTRRGHPKGEA